MNLHAGSGGGVAEGETTVGDLIGVAEGETIGGAEGETIGDLIGVADGETVGDPVEVSSGQSDPNDGHVYFPQ